MAARLTTYVVVAIVAATLIAGLIVGAQRDDSDGPVDLIVFNAKVYTADAENATAEAVAIRGNQILRVGSNREINRLRRPRTVLLDALGAAVLPGFNDANVQFIAGGLGLDAIDLLEAADAAEMQARIRTWADANPDRPWVVGRGWAAGSFQGGGPTRLLLDAAAPNRPAFILSNDGRAAWVNTRALRLAGITRKTPNPAGGVIVKEARTGEPTGVLKGAAVALAGRHVPRPTHDERARALRAAIVEAHRHGITSVQDAAAGAEDLALYEEVRRAGDLNIRVYASLPLEGAPAEPAIEQLDEVSTRYPDDPLFKSGRHPHRPRRTDRVVRGRHARALRRHAGRAGWRHRPLRRRSEPRRAAARQARVADHDDGDRRSRRPDGARRVRARRAVESESAARAPAPAGPPRAHRRRRSPAARQAQRRSRRSSLCRPSRSRTASTR